MITDNPQQISDWLDLIFSYGAFWVYGAIFIACFIENIFPPFPGDSFIAVAGGLVAVGRLDFVLSIIFIITGGVASVMIMYILGRKYGRDFFIRKNFKYFSVDDLQKFETNFMRWGWLLLVFSRFVVGFRSAIVVGAGISRYHAGKMVALSVVAYLLFIGVLYYLAMVVVENFDNISYYFKTYNTIAWPLVIAIVVGIVVRKIIKVRKQS